MTLGQLILFTIVASSYSYYSYISVLNIRATRARVKDRPTVNWADHIAWWAGVWIFTICAVVLVGLATLIVNTWNTPLR